MRTAAEFDALYLTPDPWAIGRARFRDRVLRRSIAPYINGKTVLELGCGEGHLTQEVFKTAASIKGIDISGLAITRAVNRAVPNASFERSDFLGVDFRGYDVIAAIECLYYLSAAEQDAFFAKVCAEHAGKILILSAPVIGANEHRKYFTHQELMSAFGLYDIHVTEFRNLNVFRKTPTVHRTIANLAALIVRTPFGDRLLDLVPETLIYQRCYVLRIPR